MNEQHPTPTERRGLSRAMGAAVFTYCIEQKMSDSRLPDPESPDNVSAVLRTISLHSGVSAEELTELIPDVQACIRYCNQIVGN